MKNDPNGKVDQPERAKSLTHVLSRTEHVKDIVDECAEELSSVNTGLKQELKGRPPSSPVAKVLDRSDAVEERVQEAAAELSVVNRALESEVDTHHHLEERLKAATEQRAAAQDAALHDPLTKLPNRVLFADRLEHGLAQARRHGWTLAVMFVDLDAFKAINDLHGHAVGDMVLQTIAQRLTNNTRSDDTVSRQGGDEFLYLLLDVRDEQAVAAVAEKLIALIEAPCEISAGASALSCTVSASIGISLFPKNGTTAAALVGSADRAMYTAKRSRSGYSFAG